MSLRRHLRASTVIAIALAFSVSVPAALPGARAATGLPKGNLLVNPGAEAGDASGGSQPFVTPKGWTKGNGELTAMTYKQDPPIGYPDPALSRFIGGGKRFFAGSPSVSPMSSVGAVTQRIVVPRESRSVIDRGTIPLYFSGSFGGYSNQNDRMSLTIATFDGDENGLAPQEHLLGPFAAERGNQTGFVWKGARMILPAGTRFIDVYLVAERASGAAGTDSNDGYADNLWVSFDGQQYTRGATIAVAPELSGFVIDVDLGPPGDSACLADVPVKLFKKRPGADDHVSTALTDATGHVEFDIPVDEEGSYYATVAKYGMCTAVRTATVRATT